MSFVPLPERSTGILILESAICVFINLTSLIGNILVCISMYRNQSLRTTTNLYIIALATADLLAATIVMPMTLSVLVSGTWVLGSFMCDLHAFFLNFVLFVSPTTMALTAFNRYVRIVRPSHYKIIFSKWRSRTLLASAWFFVACYVSFPKLSGLQNYGFIPGYALCHVLHYSAAGSLAHYCIVITLFLLTPLTVAIICYIKVSKTIRQHNLDVAPILHQGNPQGHITVHEIKVSKSLFVVVLAFVLCWIPAWSAAVVIRFRLVSSIPRAIQLFCSLSIYMSSAVNPFIYAGMNRSFRQEFKRILRCNSTNVAPAPPRQDLGTDETPLGGSSSRAGQSAVQTQKSTSSTSKHTESQARDTNTSN